MLQTLPTKQMLEWLAAWPAIESLRAGVCDFNDSDMGFEILTAPWVHRNGMDVVEGAPAYDHAEITAIAAATIAHDWLCLLAIKKGAKTNAVGRL